MPQFNSPLSDDEAERTRRKRGGAVEDGQYISFDISMLDADTKGSVFLNDASGSSPPLSEAALTNEIDCQYAVHVTKFRFMGDGGPPFDRDMAMFLAKNRVCATQGRAIRDVALNDGYDASSNGVSNAAEVRDAIRAAQYN